MSGTLSYIIPFYNAKNTIRETLDSVINNDNVLEIILVDDCSEDDARDIIASYLENYSKIKYMRNSTRVGAGLSRNIGARRARGDILAFLDADIVIPPNSSRIIKNYFLENKIVPQPDVVVANRAREGLCKDAVSMYKNYWTSFNFSKLKGWTSFLCSSFFAIKKDVFMDTGGFFKIPYGEDGDLGYRLSVNNYKIYFAEDLVTAHKKRFSILSLLKREFKAGRAGIKVKIRNKVLSDVIKKRRFLAVNKNFIYSFPVAVIFSLSIVLSILFLNWRFLSISILSLLSIAFLNREFLIYASCSKNYIKGVFYVLLMIPQLNIIGLGMLLGLFELLLTGASKPISFIENYFTSFLKLFIKGLLPPEEITFFVTKRCNLNCNHCFVRNKDIVKDEELTAKEIDYLSKKIGKVNYVTITGGEPFLRKDIVDIVKILNKNLRPSLITILTNGYMTDTVVDKVNEILENSQGQNILVKVSLDGPAEIHDKMRGKSGCFDCACATFVKLRSLRKIYRNLSLGIITTYTSQNRDYLEGLYEEVISDLVPDQYGLILERSNQANELNEKINIDDYIGVLKRVNMKALSSAKGWFKKFRLAYKMKMADVLKEIYRTRRYPIKCFAATLNAVISPNGDVFGCEQLKTKLGNLRERNYDWNKIWHSPQATKTRDLIKKRICFCTNECYLPFNLSYEPKQLLGVLRILIKNILI